MSTAIEAVYGGIPKFIGKINVCNWKRVQADAGTRRRYRIALDWPLLFGGFFFQESHHYLQEKGSAKGGLRERTNLIKG